VSPWLALAIWLLVVATIIPVMGMAIGYAEMKISAHMQSRIGPYFAGGRFGWAQLIADGVKFFQKEDLVPENADRPVFKMAPVLVMVGTVGLFVVIPFGPGLTPKNLDLGIFYALAISSVGTIGVLMAGWSSGNKYSLMGGLRAAGQLIAYELPLVLAVVGVVILAGTMSLDGIVQAQISWFSEAGWSLGMPFVIVQAVGLGVFFVASLAELSRIPFDMPIAESELVMGYLTEYSGFRFLFFFMGEFGTAFAFAGIASVLFLGGWYVPGLDPMSGWFNLIGPFVMFIKIMAVSALIFWFRFTFPRLREDQLQKLAWKVLIPLALLNIVVTGVVKVLV